MLGYFQMNRLGLYLVWMMVGVSLAGFFLPWIRQVPQKSTALSEMAVRSLAEEEERDYWRFVSIPENERKLFLEQPFTGSSGFSLWKSWRKPAHPLVGADMFSSRRHLNAFWIFVVPAAALLGAFFYTMTNGWGLFLGFAMTLGSYLAVRWNLQGTTLDQLVAGIHFGLGFWMGLYSLLILSFCLSIRWTVSLLK